MTDWCVQQTLYPCAVVEDAPGVVGLGECLLHRRAYRGSAVGGVGGEAVLERLARVVRARRLGLGDELLTEGDLRLCLRFSALDDREHRRDQRRYGQHGESAPRQAPEPAGAAVFADVVSISSFFGRCCTAEAMVATASRNSGSLVE